VTAPTTVTLDLGAPPTAPDGVPMRRSTSEQRCELAARARHAAGGMTVRAKRRLRFALDLAHFVVLVAVFIGPVVLFYLGTGGSQTWH
jgi:hypothetical protein